MNGGPPPEDVIVRARGVTRRFASGVAVERLDLDVRRGEIFGIVGPDGAGKTTCLRLLCGLLEPDAGEIWIAGCDVRRERDRVRERVGYVAQRSGLYGDLSVQENLDFYADLYGVPARARRERLEELLRWTRLEPFRRRRAQHLSGGMQRKLALACALLHRPEILLLDEPTTGIDPISRRDFWALLAQLRKEGMTILFTTAYLDEAERATRLGLLYRGRLLRCAPVERLRRELPEFGYEVLARDREAALGRLRACEGVLSVEPFGGALRLFLDPARASIETVRRALEDAGIADATFRRIVPSLEDVFIALIRKQERAQRDPSPGEVLL